MSLICWNRRAFSNFNLFAQRAVEQLKSSKPQQPVSEAKNLEASPSHVLSGRGYREELYSARRFEVKKDMGVALKRLQNVMNDERIFKRCKERRYFVEPFEKRNEVSYQGRRRRFDTLVRKTITDIKELDLSRHYEDHQ